MIFSFLFNQHKPKKKYKQIKQYYDLDALMHEIDVQYFNDSMSDITICWFGTQMRYNRRSLLLGRYCPFQKRVSIHRKLDSIHVPRHVIRFVIYHEMLHHIYPVVKKNGRNIIHGVEFKKAEKEFLEYIESKEWIKHNLTLMLTGELYGRS